MRKWTKVEFLLLTFVVAALLLHLPKLRADPPTRVAFLVVHTSGEYFTDEGWACSGAISAVMRGHWYVPGEFNLAVTEPLWSAVLYPVFRAFGVSAVAARVAELIFFFATLCVTYLLCRGCLDRRWSLTVLLLLSTNFLLFVYSRLAMLECVWLFFAVSSLLAFQIAVRQSSSLIATGAGLMFGLGMLAKTTEITIVVPVLVIALVHYGQNRDLIRILRTAYNFALGFILVQVPYHLLVVRPHATDVQYFYHLNVAMRVASANSSLRHRLAILRNLHQIGIILLSSLLCALLLAVWRKRSIFLTNTLALVFLSWLLTMLLAMAVVGYSPPRYFVSIVFPAVILAVVAIAELWNTVRKFSVCLLCALLAGGGIDTVMMIQQLAHPVYSFASLSHEIHRLQMSRHETSRAVMTNFAYSLSLFEPILPVNDTEGEGPATERIEKFDPGYYVELDPTPVTCDFRVSGRSLIPAAKVQVLQRSATIFRVERR